MLNLKVSSVKTFQIGSEMWSFEHLDQMLSCLTADLEFKKVRNIKKLNQNTLRLHEVAKKRQLWFIDGF